MCSQHEQHQKGLEVQFEQGRLESLNSLSDENQYSDDLEYHESYVKLTASLEPLDT